MYVQQEMLLHDPLLAEAGVSKMTEKLGELVPALFDAETLTLYVAELASPVEQQSM